MSPVETVLCIQTGSLVDILAVLPAAASMAAEPVRRVWVAVPERYTDLVSLAPWIERVISLIPDDAGAASAVADQATACDAVVNFAADDAVISGALWKVRPRRVIQIFPTNPAALEARWYTYLESVMKEALATTLEWPVFMFPDCLRAEAQEERRRVLPDAADKAVCWFSGPTAQWLPAVQLATSEPWAELVCTGTAPVSQLPATAPLAIHVAAAAIDEATLCVSGNPDLVHLACLLGVPTVYVNGGLDGANDPMGNWHVRIRSDAPIDEALRAVDAVRARRPTG